MVMRSQRSAPLLALDSARSSNRARQWQLIRAELPSKWLSAAVREFKKNARQWRFIRAERSSIAPAERIAHSRAHLCPRASSLFFF